MIMNYTKAGLATTASSIFTMVFPAWMNFTRVKQTHSQKGIIEFDQPSSARTMKNSI